MSNTVEIILVPTLIILLGYALKKWNILKNEDSNLLSKIVINICLPSMIFSNIAVANISLDMAVLPLISFSFCMLCVLIGFLYSKIRHYSKVKTWTVVIAIALMNTGFLGYPINLGLFGNPGFIRAVFYDLYAPIVLALFGVCLVSVFGGNRRNVIKSVLTFVPLWSVILGTLFNLFNIPLGHVLTNTLGYLGDATIPLIMLSLGLTIEFRDLKKYWFDTTFVSVFRLVISPLLMFIILSLFNFNGLSFNVAVIEAGMATAMTSQVLAVTYRLDIELMSTLIFVTTVLSLVSISIISTVLI